MSLGVKLLFRIFLYAFCIFVHFIHSYMFLRSLSSLGTNPTHGSLCLCWTILKIKNVLQVHMLFFNNVTVDWFDRAVNMSTNCLKPLTNRLTLILHSHELMSHSLVCLFDQSWVRQPPVTPHKSAGGRRCGPPPQQWTLLIVTMWSLIKCKSPPITPRRLIINHLFFGEELD